MNSMAGREKRMDLAVHDQLKRQIKHRSRAKMNMGTIQSFATHVERGYKVMFWDFRGEYHQFYWLLDI